MPTIPAPPSARSASAQRLDLSYVRPHHREIARRLVLGQKYKDIAASIGITTVRLSQLCQSPLFKMEIRRLEEGRDRGVFDIQTSLQEAAPMALEVLERTMYDGASEKLRLKAAESILDRAGYGAVNKSVNVTASTNLTGMTNTELKDMLAQRLMRVAGQAAADERMAAEAESIDIKFEEVEPTTTEDIERELAPPFILGGAEYGSTVE